MSDFAQRVHSRSHELRAAVRHLLPSTGTEAGGDYRGVMLAGMSKYVSIQAGSLAIAYLTQLLVARWLGTSDFGFYSLAMTVAAILAHIATLGFPTALDRFLPQYAEDGDWHLYRGLLRRSLHLTVACGAVILIVSAPVIYFLDYPGVEKICLLIGMALVPVLGVSDVLSGALQSLKRIVGAYLPDQVLAPLGFLGVVALMHFVLDDLDAIHMLAAMLAAQLFSVLLQSGWLRTALPADYLQAQPAYKVGKWLKTAMPVLFMTMFGIIVYRADLLIVGLLLGRTQAGIYAAVLTTAELIGLFLSAGRAVASPRIAPLQKHGDTAGLQRLMTLLARYAFVPSLLAFIVVVVFGHQALALFGTGFDAGYNALIVLAASQVAKAAFGGPAILLLLTGRQVVVAKVYLVAMVLDVAAQLALIPWLGLIGAATASLLTVVIAQSVQTVIAARRMGIYTSIFGPLAERA